MPFFHFTVVASRRELDDIAPRLQLLMDVLSEDLPELHNLVKEEGMRFINEVRTEGLPRIEEDHTAELIQQLEVLEILCETKIEKHE